jgi:hypothetical protein
MEVSIPVIGNYHRGSVACWVARGIVVFSVEGCWKEEVEGLVRQHPFRDLECSYCNIWGNGTEEDFRQ